MSTQLHIDEVANLVQENEDIHGGIVQARHIKMARLGDDCSILGVVPSFVAAVQKGHDGRDVIFSKNLALQRALDVPNKEVGRDLVDGRVHARHGKVGLHGERHCDSERRVWPC